MSKAIVRVCTHKAEWERLWGRVEGEDGVGSLVGLTDCTWHVPAHLLQLLSISGCVS